MSGHGKIGSYVLITPARNEAEYIGKTLDSVLAQTALPRRWIIVSDGSTDRTEEIVNYYAAQNDFIYLVRSVRTDNRNFGSKVRAFWRGYACVKNIDYDFVGNLDADITLPSNYYERVIAKCSENTKLGISGGVIVDEVDGKLIKRMGSLYSVGCAIQLFRRQCYEDIGGYLPLKIGGEDAAAEIMARMRGWQVRAFPDLRVIHNRRTGSGMWSVWGARFHRGQEDYLLGYHPAFFTAKCLRRVVEKPYLIGSLLMGYGYILSCLRRDERQVPADLVQYLRGEQVEKLCSRFMGVVGTRKRVG